MKYSTNGQAPDVDFRRRRNQLFRYIDKCIWVYTDNRITIYTLIRVFIYPEISVDSYADSGTYRYSYIPIYTHPNSYPCRYSAIQKNSYTDSCMYGYMTDRNEGYQSAITEPVCEKHPQNPLFCPLRYNPTFLFRIVQVVFLYVQRSYLGRTHKNRTCPEATQSLRERAASG